MNYSTASEKIKQSKVPQTLDFTGDFGIVDNVDIVDIKTVSTKNIGKIKARFIKNYPPDLNASKH